MEHIIWSNGILSLRTGFTASLAVDLHDLLKHLLLDALLEIDVVVELSHLSFQRLDDLFVPAALLLQLVLVEHLNLLGFEVDHWLSVRVIIHSAMEGWSDGVVLEWELCDERIFVG